MQFGLPEWPWVCDRDTIGDENCGADLGIPRASVLVRPRGPCGGDVENRVGCVCVGVCGRVEDDGSSSEARKRLCRCPRRIGLWSREPSEWYLEESIKTCTGVGLSLSLSLLAQLRRPHLRHGLDYLCRLADFNRQQLVVRDLSEECRRRRLASILLNANPASKRVQTQCRGSCCSKQSTENPLPVPNACSDR